MSDKTFILRNNEVCYDSQFTKGYNNFLYKKKSYKIIVILNVENKVEKLFTSNKKKNYRVIIIRNIKI